MVMANKTTYAYLLIMSSYIHGKSATGCALYPYFTSQMERKVTPLLMVGTEGKTS